MKKITLIPLIIIIVGVCLAFAGFAAGGMQIPWVDRDGWHTSRGHSNLGALITVDETYKGVKAIDVRVDFVDRVTFKEGSEFAVRGQNYERLGGLKAENSDGVLKVDATRDKRLRGISLSDWQSWLADDTWIEITYPKNAGLGAVSVEIGAGQLSVNGISADKLDIVNDFGNVEVTDAGTGTMSVNLSAGDVKVANVSADTLKIINDFGKITLDGASADSLTIKNSAGDIRADSVNTGLLDVVSDFGSVRFGNLVFSGKAEIDQNSGEVELKLDMSEADVSYELTTSAGSVNVDGRKSGGSVINRNSGAAANLIVNSDFGGINVKFLK